MKNLKLIGVKNIIMMIVKGESSWGNEKNNPKLVKYLYKHNFKYENKPIKWMCRNEQKQKPDAIYSLEGAGNGVEKVDVFFASSYGVIKRCFLICIEKKWNLRLRSENFLPL